MSVVDQHRKERVRRLFRDPADIPRASLPQPGNVGSLYCWGRTLRAAAEVLAQSDLDGAEQLLDRLVDPVERAIGLATLATQAVRSGDPRAFRLRVATAETLAQIPDHVGPDLDIEAADPALAMFDPQVRARFEIAVRFMPDHLHAAVDLMAPTGNEYLCAVVMATGLCRILELLDTDDTFTSLSPADRAAFGTTIMPDVEKESDPLVHSALVCRIAAITNHLGVRFPIQRIPIPVYRAFAIVLTADDPASAARTEVARLPKDVPPHHLVAVTVAAAAAAEERGDQPGATTTAHWASDLALSTPTTENRARTLLQVLTEPALDQYLDPLGLFTV